jgi:hypothetical protein
MCLQYFVYCAHLCMFFGPQEFCSLFYISCLQRWEYTGWSKSTITQPSSSSNFKWTPLPHVCVLLVSIFFLCLCVCVILCFMHAFTCFLGLWSFASLHLFPICKGGNVVTKIGTPSLKLLQTQTLGEHFHPLYMFFLCPCSSRVYVCSLVFLYAPLHVFWSPFFLSYLQGWECNGWGRNAIAQVFF